MKWDTQFVCKVRGGALVVNVKQLGDKILLAEHSTDGTSLTNCIEGVIEALSSQIFHASGDLWSDFEWYQWCEGEGLFKLELSRKVTRDMPNFKVNSWLKLSNELTAFEVLFA